MAAIYWVRDPLVLQRFYFDGDCWLLQASASSANVGSQRIQFKARIIYTLKWLGSVKVKYRHIVNVSRIRMNVSLKHESCNERITFFGQSMEKMTKKRDQKVRKRWIVNRERFRIYFTGFDTTIDFGIFDLLLSNFKVSSGCWHLQYFHIST